MDSGGALHRHRGGRAHCLHHAHDRRAAADRHVPRLRSAGSRAGRYRGVLPAPAQRVHRTGGLRHGGPGDRNPARLPHLHGKPDGHGQTSGDPALASAGLQEPERHQFRALCHRAGARRAHHPGAHRHLDLPRLRRPLALVRRPPDSAHRRRGHAHRDRVVELLRRPLRLRHGLRARQQTSRDRRRSGWLERSDSLHHHVQGHEPLVHQRAVRRVRADPDLRRQDRAAAPSLGQRRRSRRGAGSRVQRDHHSRATAWP